MKTRKPGIRNASRKTRKPRAPRRGAPLASTAEVVQVLVERTQHIQDTESAILDRLDKLEKSPPALVLDALVAKQLQDLTASLRGIEEAVVKVAEHLLATPEKAPRKPREPKTETPPAPAAERTNGATAAQQGPGAKCHCGKSFVGASGGHGAVKCEDPAPAKPAEEKPSAGPTVPTFEKFREAAVAYAQKHTKAKMLEVLAKHLPEGSELKLSLVPEAKRQAAMDAFVAF